MPPIMLQSLKAMRIAMLAGLCGLINTVVAESAPEQTGEIITSHGFALYGDLKYPKGFSHYDHVNPEAPKGGHLRLMGFGTFDSLNPYTLKGTSPFNTPGQFMYGFSELNETLLAGTGSYLPSGDEPQSAYGLLAESLSYPDDLSWVEFRLRKQAHFHDAHPIEAEDVVFSFETLIAHGHPRFQQALLNIQSVEALDRHTVRVSFKQAHQGANILRFGEMPVLPKHYWADKDFARASQQAPLLSGPYRLSKFDIGNSIELERVPDFWGASLNIYRGRFNFDRVSIHYYRDQTIAFEAFKAGEFDLYYDYTAKNWASAYDFPALKDGRVLKQEIHHKIPSGTQGFFFNTRRELFQDPRVRKALSLVFDFEWTNKNLFNDAYVRNNSYYPNSDFAAEGIPQGEELALLEPHRHQLPAALFAEPYSASASTGNGNMRQPIRTATRLLKEAGWRLVDHQLQHQQSGRLFEFEILIRQPGLKRVILPYIRNLEKLGITANLRLVDATQYKVRIDNFDYDMMTFVLSQGQAPSYEQRDYFHSSNRHTIGSQNYAGVDHPVVDALIEHVISARTRSRLVSAMKALDRVLLWQHYSVPNWHLNYHRLAYWNKFDQPASTPDFTLGVDRWWSQEQRTNTQDNASETRRP